MSKPGQAYTPQQLLVAWDHEFYGATPRERRKMLMDAGCELPYVWSVKRLANVAHNARERAEHPGHHRVTRQDLEVARAYACARMDEAWEERERMREALCRIDDRVDRAVDDFDRARAATVIALSEERDDARAALSQAEARVERAVIAVVSARDAIEAFDQGEVKP